MQKIRHVSFVLQDERRFGSHLGENCLMLKDVCRTQKLQSSINIHPSLPFPLDDNRSRSKEQPFRRHCLQERIPLLYEFHSSMDKQEVISRQNQHEDKEAHLLLVVHPRANPYGRPSTLAPFSQRTYRVEDPVYVQLVRWTLDDALDGDLNPGITAGVHGGQHARSHRSAADQRKWTSRAISPA